jgi:diguanylate cyclase (GGDEF)-like protein/PAS domain S-box-containing protein
MPVDKRPEPPQDGTLIGADFDSYLRPEADESLARDVGEGFPATELHPAIMVASMPSRADAEAAQSAATKSPSIAAKAFAFSGTTMFVTDRQHRFVVTCNAAFLAMTGYEYGKAIGVHPDTFASARSADSLAEMRHALGRSAAWDGDVWIRRCDGTEFPARLAVRPIYESGAQRVSGYVTTVTDMSAFKHAEDQLRHLALHDPLTGLVNRTVLQDRLDQALAACRRTGGRLALLFIDLDRFKYINDSLGHATGDELLRRAAGRLKSCVRDEDTVARMGGDEFVVLLRDVPNANAAAQVALKLGRKLHRPYRIDNQELTVTMSIGISLYPDNGAEGSTLLQHADTAMYRAKEDGRNRYVFHQSEMTAKVHELFAIENSLALALQRDEFVMHYQPQMEIATGRISGAEALIRWQHPELGLLGPDRFIPIAEETGLIRKIGEWVIRAVGSDMKVVREAGYSSLRMAINLSALQIGRPQHTESVRKAIIDAGMAETEAEFEVEITESSLMTGDQALAATSALKNLGLSLAIDDFGTGYSSMLALRQLPIDRIKIDRSFIKGLPEDANDAAMTAAVIAMGKALGLSLLAEGVETRAQLDFLRAHGCEEAQGFLFSHPLPIEEFLELLANYVPASDF